MDIDLRLLRHARALAETGNFARAARAVHLTQPALSRSIQLLEQRVGALLFDRSRQRVEPTDVGRLFIEHARAVLEQAEALEREVAAIRGLASGRVSIGAGTYASSMFVERALAEFVARNPDVAIRVVNDSGAELAARLRRGDVDLFVGSLPHEPEASGLQVQRLSTRSGRFFARPGHPLASRRGLALDEVLRWPLVLPTRVPLGLAEAILRARSDSTATPPDFTCESVGMMRTVAATADRVMVGSVSMGAEEVFASRLRVLDTVGEPLSQEFGIVRLAGRTLPQTAETLVEAIVEADHASLEQERVLAARLDALCATTPGSDGP